MKWILNLLWMSAVLTVQAKEADLKQPLTIQADLQEFTTDNQMVYKGNVRLQQGSLSLQSDSLTVVLNEKQETERFQAEGRPVHYRQQSQNGEWIDAEAASANFSVKTRVLTLTKARLKQARHQITSDRIEYDTANNRFSAVNATTIRYPETPTETVPPAGNQP